MDNAPSETSRLFRTTATEYSTYLTSQGSVADEISDYIHADYRLHIKPIPCSIDEGSRLADLAFFRIHRRSHHPLFKMRLLNALTFASGVAAMATGSVQLLTDQQIDQDDASLNPENAVAVVAAPE